MKAGGSHFFGLFSSFKPYEGFKKLLKGAALMIAVWLLGLIYFSLYLSRFVSPLEAAEATVVLTGGRERLKVGFEILAHEQGKKLFISGVHSGVTLDDLLKATGQKNIVARHNVILGHAALDTVGNASETSAWLKREGFSTVRLVTSRYHMPRSLLEFQKAMPGVKFIPHPVHVCDFEWPHWQQWPSSMGMIVKEYNKYLVTLARHCFKS